MIAPVRKLLFVTSNGLATLVGFKTPDPAWRVLGVVRAPLWSRHHLRIGAGRSAPAPAILFAYLHCGDGAALFVERCQYPVVCVREGGNAVHLQLFGNRIQIDPQSCQPS